LRAILEVDHLDVNGDTQCVTAPTLEATLGAALFDLALEAIGEVGGFQDEVAVQDQKQDEGFGILRSEVCRRVRGGGVIADCARFFNE
jgi:hypothetical protein